jgi:hypothetical protein
VGERKGEEKEPEKKNNGKRRRHSGREGERLRS